MFSRHNLMKEIEKSKKEISTILNGLLKKYVRLIVISETYSKKTLMISLYFLYNILDLWWATFAL